MSNSVSIGIRFINNPLWTGGMYYIYNLVNSFNALPTEKKPQVTVFCNSTDLPVIEENLHYPGLKLFFIDEKPGFLKRALNKLSLIFRGKPVYPRFPDDVEADLVFPNAEEWLFRKTKKVSWIPDFQEDHLPYLFTKEELDNRVNAQKETVKKSEYLVLSSFSAQKDFKRIYPGSKAKTFVLPFAVTHPDYSGINAAELKKKYQLPDEFFFCANQFWTHKNHTTLIEAIKICVASGQKIIVALSGKEYDFRDPEYTKKLKDLVAQYGLNEHIRFLGFLDRKEQLALMNVSQAIIQPSLFEGWSTVIEDAKAMSQLIIASDLDVHDEQLQNWPGTKLMFKRKDPADLAEKIKEVSAKKIQKKKADYNPSLVAYAEALLNLSAGIK